MPRKTRSKSTTSQVEDQRLARLSQDSQDTQDSISNETQNSQKIKGKNYSREEQEALLRCSEKFHAIISKNSSHDKVTAQKQRAWENIKISFDEYCKSQGIYVSSNSFIFVSFNLEFCLNFH